MSDFNISQGQRSEIELVRAGRGLRGARGVGYGGALFFLAGVAECGMTGEAANALEKTFEAVAFVSLPLTMYWSLTLRWAAREIIHDIKDRHGASWVKARKHLLNYGARQGMPAHVLQEQSNRRPDSMPIPANGLGL
jgi:hypothetical protein